MIHTFLGRIKSIFTRNRTLTEITETTTTETPTAPPEGVFSLNHPWPFRGTQPNLSHVEELARGTVTVGDHVFYVWEGQRRRYLRTSRGTETFAARRVIWWLEGRKDPDSINSVMSTCGEEKCIRLDHLALGFPKTPVKDKPVPSEKPSTKTDSEEIKVKGDRTKCYTRKVYYDSKAAATTQASFRNKPENRKGGPRLFVYKCPCCFGYHLTKQEPSKKTKKKGQVIDKEY